MAKENKWKIERIANRHYRRPFVWQVTCPEPPAELTWDNDFGRGMRCGCRRFRTEGKATRYVERMKNESLLLQQLEEFLITGDS